MSAPTITEIFSSAHLEILAGRLTAINRTSRVVTPDGKLRWIDSFVGIVWAGAKAAPR
jgi:hypothetical protein